MDHEIPYLLDGKILVLFQNLRVVNYTLDGRIVDYTSPVWHCTEISITPGILCRYQSLANFFANISNLIRFFCLNQLIYQLLNKTLFYRSNCDVKHNTSFFFWLKPVWRCLKLNLLIYLYTTIFQHHTTFPNRRQYN